MVLQLVNGIEKEYISGYDKTNGFGKIYLKNVDIMQYTGEKDINGTEIYEGDIVMYTFNKEIKVDVIVFEDGMFQCKKANTLSFDGHKVLGNI